MHMESLYVLQWVVILFVFTCVIGVIAPIGGVGGGVLFVPLATAFLPFHVDFIRGAGLVMALTSALSSSPLLLKRGLTNLRVAVPVATVSITTSIAGSIIGLWYTNRFARGEAYFVLLLGALLLFIFGFMISSRRVEYPDLLKVGSISRKLGLGGSWYELSLQKTVSYGTTNFIWGMLSFAVVGFIAGMFGLGAGWASVPVLNLVMGVPLKVAAATSLGIIVFNGAAATWVYLAQGAILPLICIPSVAGMSIGARIGARLAVKVKAHSVKYIVLGIMLCAAILNILKGLRGIGVI